MCFAVVLGLLAGKANSASSMPFVRATPPPVFYLGVEIGFDLNAFSNLSVDYPGSFVLKSVPVAIQNHWYIGLVSDYYLNDPENLEWLLSTKILLHVRSFTVAAAKVDLPLELHACGGKTSGAGDYEVAIANTEWNISAVLSRTLKKSKGYWGWGLVLEFRVYTKRVNR